MLAVKMKDGKCVSGLNLCKPKRNPQTYHSLVVQALQLLVAAM